MYSPVSQRPNLASCLSDWEFPPLDEPDNMPGKRQRVSIKTYQEHNEDSSENDMDSRRRQPKRIPTPTPDANVPGATQATSRPSSTMTTTASSTSWPSQDDTILINARTQGYGWSQIQKQFFPGKTANACRKRYERLVAKRRGSDWGIEKLEKLGAEYRVLREQMWKPLADAMGERWDHVEKACFERGLKSLLSSGRAGRSDESRHDSIQDEEPTAHDVPSPSTPTPSSRSRMISLDYILTK